jgi:hypothetical protein
MRTKWLEACGTTAMAGSVRPDPFALEAVLRMEKGGGWAERAASPGGPKVAVGLTHGLE